MSVCPRGLNIDLFQYPSELRPPLRFVRMDDYSAKTKDWLDERFKRVDPDGVYVAHQPIYGFRVGHCACARFATANYTRTVAALNALSGCQVATLLDVGSAEGYTSFLAARLLGIPHVECCDLSLEAVKRAQEIFGFTARQADVHALPYRDHEFEAVLCSETLEHVADTRRATAELTRVARKLIVITVPNEEPEKVKEERESGLIHGHINAFDPHSFDYLQEEGWVVFHKRLLCRSLYRLRVLADAERLDLEGKNAVKQLLFKVYNRSTPFVGRVLNRHMVAMIIRLDRLLCRFSRQHFAHLFTLVRSESVSELKKSPGLNIPDLLKASVPFHYL